MTGRVTMDGKPLVGKEIVFAPEGDGRASIGLTDENGEYYLMYTADWEGAMLGKHKVTITTPPPRDPGPEFEAWRETVPLKYNGETILTAEVKDEDNEFNFNLESE